MTERTYDFSNTLPDLDGGVLLQKLSTALKDTALNTVIYGDKGKKGKVVLEMTLQRIGDSSQVVMSHKLVYDRPTRRGKTSEEDVTETMLYVSTKGAISIQPDTQTDWLEGAKD